LYRARGHTYQSNHDYERAIADFNFALEHSPDDAITLLDRGAAYFAMRRFSKAISDYRTSLLRLTDPRLYNNLGNVYGAQGKLDGAITAYNEALRIHPGYAEALRNREGALKAKSTGQTIITDAE
jgi:tetratricopeptide (TPR) repeat protein